MNVLITGGTGFIGKRLYRYLRANVGHGEVVPWIYSRRTGGDILDHETLSGAVQGKDLVIHLAANTHVDFGLHGDIREQNRYAATNVMGTQNVLWACREHGAKMIHISTSEVYGTNQNPGEPMTEDHPLEPTAGCYAATKSDADHHCRMAFEAMGQDVVILRPFNQVGPGQSKEKLFPRFIEMGLEGEPLTIYGDGLQSRDYVHVDDTARAIWMARNLPAGTICNVGTESRYTIKEIAEAIVSATGDKTMPTHVPNPRQGAEVQELIGSYEKLNKLTGWEPEYYLDEIVDDLVGWYRANGPIAPPLRAEYPQTTTTGSGASVSFSESASETTPKAKIPPWPGYLHSKR